ncbi:hypothetical protein U1Q18_036662 [Sarracenia purpurea var. burkii]
MNGPVFLSLGEGIPILACLTTTELRTGAQIMPQGNNSPTTKRPFERSERDGSSNGALSFSQTFLNESTEYNLLNRNYEQNLLVASITQLRD